MGLFNNKLENHNHGAVDCVIGSQARFKGELISSGSVQVSGQFEGKLDVAGELIIGAGSEVIGEISGNVVIVSGEVQGNITAKHSLEITRSGRVHGDLTGGKVLIEEGCSYTGRVSVNEEVAADAPVYSSNPDRQS